MDLACPMWHWIVHTFNILFCIVRGGIWGSSYETDVNLVM